MQEIHGYIDRAVTEKLKPVTERLDELEGLVREDGNKMRNNNLTFANISELQNLSPGDLEKFFVKWVNNNILVNRQNWLKKKSPTANIFSTKIAMV